MLLYDASRGTAPEGGSAAAGGAGGNATEDGTGRGTVLVLLHGRGCHRGDLQALRTMVPRSWTLMTPQAPFPGHLWGYGPGWAWYRHLGEDRVDEESLEKSLSALDGFLQELPGLLGAPPAKIFLGGFSQGGTVSLSYALGNSARTQEVRPTGILNFSGFLPAEVMPLPADRDGSLPPIFWAHGRKDPNVPFSLAERGRSVLRNAGVAVEEGDYDAGHWIAPSAMTDAVAFARSLSGAG